MYPKWATQGSHFLLRIPPTLSVHIHLRPEASERIFDPIHCFTKRTCQQLPFKIQLFGRCDQGRDFSMSVNACSETARSLDDTTGSHIRFLVQQVTDQQSPSKPLKPSRRKFCLEKCFQTGVRDTDQISSPLTPMFRSPDGRTRRKCHSSCIYFHYGPHF